MTQQNDKTHTQQPDPDTSSYLPPRDEGYGLLRKIMVYHFALAMFCIAVALAFPEFVEQLPIGGIEQLADSSDLTFSSFEDTSYPAEDIQIVETFIRTTSQFDRLGYARQLMIVLVGVWLFMLPVSWVHKGIHKKSSHDHSLDETTLVLPGIVAAIVLVVQHSLALAFSLAGIVAGVQFRRALQDTYDALFILVAIGTGLAAGVQALEIAAVLTVFFCYASMYVYYLGDGLESHHAAHLSALKQQRKKEAAEQKAAQVQRDHTTKS